MAQRMQLGRELRHLARISGHLVLYVYVPFSLLMVAWHYPYDTDATSAAAESGNPGAIAFYEAAYRPTAGKFRGLDYEETAARAAKGANVEGRVRAFVRQFGLEHKRVLDIGSGRGYLQDLVADYTGLDLSPKVASYYHKPFVVGSATDMPFADDSFDAAWTVWVVEHIPEPEKAFREMRRVIKPGGVLFLMVAWNTPSWASGGFTTRPYGDFNLAGKLVKATVPIRSTQAFHGMYLLPIRAMRWARYSMKPQSTSLQFRALEANYEVYWEPDSDAAISLDRFETLLWFRSRGDECLNCGTMAGQWTMLRDEPLILRINRQ